MTRKLAIRSFTSDQTNRTPLDCMRHGTIRKTHVWTPESDLALLEAIKIYGLNNWLLGASQGHDGLAITDGKMSSRACSFARCNSPAMSKPVSANS